jgi:hypothetical protein
MRCLMLLGVVAMAGCASNRGSEEPEARIRDTTMTGQDTLTSSDTSRGTREIPEADSADRRMLKVPGDSVRLEDTLSAPPPSGDSAPSQR